MPGVTLEGDADPLAEIHSRVTGFVDCPSFETVDELLAAGVDAVTIAAPTHLHRDVSLACIAHGAHVLVEKPIATTGEEGHEIINAARKAGVTQRVGHVERFNPEDV